MEAGEGCGAGRRKGKARGPATHTQAEATVGVVTWEKSMPEGCKEPDEKARRALREMAAAREPSILPKKKKLEKT